eukprot:COSAG01_NODE_31_length_35900_cov_44.332169_9_plen_183_part_00
MALPERLPRAPPAPPHRRASARAALHHHGSWACALRAGLRIVHLALGATLDAAVALATGEPTVVKLTDRDEDGLVRSIRAVRRIMAAEGTPVGRRYSLYVSSCLKRYFKRGDPWVTNDRWRRCGKRATRRQRVWMKNRLRRDPTMYFDELSKEMHAKFGRSISDCMISSALRKLYREAEPRG